MAVLEEVGAVEVVMLIAEQEALLTRTRSEDPVIELLKVLETAHEMMKVVLKDGMCKQSLGKKKLLLFTVSSESWSTLGPRSRRPQG